MAPAQFKDTAVALLETDDRHLWLAATDGSLFWLEPSRTWQAIPETDLRGPNRTIYEDREGNLWRGSFAYKRRRITRLTGCLAASVALDGATRPMGGQSSRCAALANRQRASCQRCSNAFTPSTGFPSVKYATGS